MGEHRKKELDCPSRARITWAVVCALAVVTASVYVALGLDTEHLVGLGLGVVLVVVTMGHALGLMIQRADVQDAIHWERQRRHRAERLHEEREIEQTRAFSQVRGPDGGPLAPLHPSWARERLTETAVINRNR